MRKHRQIKGADNQPTERKVTLSHINSFTAEMEYISAQIKWYELADRESKRHLFGMRRINRCRIEPQRVYQ